jgi:phosphatidylinositol-3,4,5-trisphosphate 3-phosphatase/dual-specificity protein phosphatase PTEN
MAMAYYARKRFDQKGMGVTQPCQIRYIHYFHEILNGPRRSPSVVALDRVILTGENKISKPYIKLKEIRTNKEIVTSKSSINQIENIKFEKTK